MLDYFPWTFWSNFWDFFFIFELVFYPYHVMSIISTEISFESTNITESTFIGLAVCILWLSSQTFPSQNLISNLRPGYDQSLGRGILCNWRSARLKWKRRGSERQREAVKVVIWGVRRIWQPRKADRVNTGNGKSVVKYYQRVLARLGEAVPGKEDLIQTP